MTEITYGMVNDLWPKGLRVIDTQTATKLGQRLFDRFNKIEGGRRHFLFRNKRGWASTERTRDDERHGLRDMVHTVSHYVIISMGNMKGHGPVHARIEYQMIEYVIRKGWHLPPVVVKPTIDEERTSRLASIDQRIKRLETRAKRTATALKKAKQQRARVLKALSVTTHRPASGQPIVQQQEA